MELNELQRALLDHLVAARGPISRAWADRHAGTYEVKGLLKYGYLDASEGTVRLGRLYPFYSKYGFRNVIDIMQTVAHASRMSRLSVLHGSTSEPMPVEHEYLVNELKQAGIEDLEKELKRMGISR
ncbi:MAG: hypothetical protein IAE95_12160 [Chitinophagaceae bacterium]|nr:hypothetical protein [Chitinophagaceae bacterium]